MRDPWPQSVRLMLETCRKWPAGEVLSSEEWAELRTHCGELAVELDSLGHRTIAQRVDRDYARVHEQLREAKTPGTTASLLLRADAIAELASTLTAVQRFQAPIVATHATPAEHLLPDPTVQPTATEASSMQAGGPEPDPHDTRTAIWVGKRIYLGDDTQVSRLFWLLARPVGAARSYEEVQRAVDGVEPDHHRSAHEEKKAEQRMRKAISKLREAMEEAKLDHHVVIVRGGPQTDREYSMVWRYSR
jgi:hypothetical protein